MLELGLLRAPCFGLRIVFVARDPLPDFLQTQESLHTASPRPPQTSSKPRNRYIRPPRPTSQTTSQTTLQTTPPDHHPDHPQDLSTYLPTCLLPRTSSHHLRTSISFHLPLTYLTYFLPPATHLQPTSPTSPTCYHLPLTYLTYHLLPHILYLTYLLPPPSYLLPTSPTCYLLHHIPPPTPPPPYTRAWAAARPLFR